MLVINANNVIVVATFTYDLFNAIGWSYLLKNDFFYLFFIGCDRFEIRDLRQTHLLHLIIHNELYLAPFFDAGDSLTQNMSVCGHTARYSFIKSKVRWQMCFFWCKRKP